jgi:hypothetical protein
MHNLESGHADNCMVRKEEKRGGRRGEWGGGAEKEKGNPLEKIFVPGCGEWDYWKFCAQGLPGFLPFFSSSPHWETKLNIQHSVSPPPSLPSLN